MLVFVKLLFRFMEDMFFLFVVGGDAESTQNRGRAQRLARPAGLFRQDFFDPRCRKGHKFRRSSQDSPVLSPHTQAWVLGEEGVCDFKRFPV